MKKILLLVAVNVLLFNLVLRETNNDDALNFEKMASVVYIDKNNSQSELTLYTDYSAEFTKCDDECQTVKGSFSVDNDVLTVVTLEDTLVLDINIDNTLNNDHYSFVLK